MTFPFRHYRVRQPIRTLNGLLYRPRPDPSGRSSVEADFAARKSDERKLPREITSVIKSIPEDQAVIVFTFKHRGRKGAVDIPGIIKRDLKTAGVDLDWYTTRERDADEVLPWDHLDSGLDKQWLWDDWQDALAEFEQDDCRWTPCFDCGVCTTMGTDIQIGPTGRTLLPLAPR